MTAANAGQQLKSPSLTPDEVLKIARQDAETAYDDLTGFRITLLLLPDGWHVDYDLTDRYVAGGGPRYVIDPESGAILSKVYEQ